MFPGAQKKTAGGAFLPCRPLIGLIFIASGRESENNHNTDCDTIKRIYHAGRLAFIIRTI